MESMRISDGRYQYQSIRYFDAETQTNASIFYSIE